MKARLFFVAVCLTLFLYGNLHSSGQGIPPDQALKTGLHPMQAARDKKQ
jgi:hypothetical protein